MICIWLANKEKERSKLPQMTRRGCKWLFDWQKPKQKETSCRRQGKAANDCLIGGEPKNLSKPQMTRRGCQWWFDQPKTRKEQAMEEERGCQWSFVCLAENRKQAMGESTKRTKKQNVKSGFKLSSIFTCGVSADSLYLPAAQHYLLDVGAFPGTNTLFCTVFLARNRISSPTHNASLLASPHHTSQPFSTT